MTKHPNEKRTLRRIARCAALSFLTMLPWLVAAGEPPFSNKEIGFSAKPAHRPEFERLRTDVLRSLQTVGVMPLDAGNAIAAIPSSAETIARIETEIVTRLTAAGFKVVPPSEMRLSREVAAATAGTLFDPVTGEADELRIEQYQQLVWKDYRSRHTVDGYVMSAIAVRQATENSGGSSWDGVTDATTGLGAFANLMSGSKRQMAVMPALSLAVWMTDSNLRLQYQAAGGLHLLMYLRKPLGAPVDYVEVAAGPQLMSAPRVARALDVIFDPILKSEAQLAAEKNRSKRKDRDALEYAPAVGDRAPDGSEFISPADFGSRYKTILVAPLQWSNPARKSKAAAQFEKLVAEKLTALGKAVIPPERLLDALMPYAAKAERMYDTRTGYIDRANFESIRATALADIARASPFDAVLYPTIVGRPALFENGEAFWAGTRQLVTGDATGLEAKLSDAGRKLGTIPALVLQLRLTDPSGKILYEGGGGIELMENLRDNGFIEKSAWDLLADQRRNAASIDLALQRLLQTRSR